jgi:hypothetical protein
MQPTFSVDVRSRIQSSSGDGLAADSLKQRSQHVANEECAMPARICRTTLFIKNIITRAAREKIRAAKKISCV